MFLIIVNAINFIDGIDGLAISEVIKTIVLIEFFSAGFTALYPMGFVLVATMLPLYYFNFKKKRKVFLGDGGSLLLGTIAAVYAFYVLGADFSLKPTFTLNKTLFAVLVLLYPLVDLLRVFVLRIKAGKSPFEADQRHLHHKILSKTKNSFFSIILILLVEALLILACFFYI